MNKTTKVSYPGTPALIGAITTEHGLTNICELKRPVWYTSFEYGGMLHRAYFNNKPEAETFNVNTVDVNQPNVVNVEWGIYQY